MDQKPVLAHARVEVKALTEGIRKGLQEQGMLDKEEFTFRSIVKGQWEDLTLSCRDRVMFTATNNDLSVINGTEGTVESIRKDKSGGYELVVRIDASKPKEIGRLVKFNTSEHNALAHRYAMTVHKAQGQGKSEVYHLATIMGMLDQQSALVAFTRLTKGSYRIYATDDVMERMAERLGTERQRNDAERRLVRDPVGSGVQPGPRCERPTRAIEAQSAGRRREAAGDGAIPMISLLT